MTIESLKGALVDELRDILSAEEQLTQAIPAMVKNARDQELKKVLECHQADTEQQVERVKQSLKSLGSDPEPKTCQAMKGLIAEGEQLMSQGPDNPIGDALLIAAAQKVQHYEIASYGTAMAWANILGADDVVNNLKSSLEEEKTADQKLTELAERLNKSAFQTANA
jgi:ferritin-like metal-binding protein YciE